MSSCGHARFQSGSDSGVLSDRPCCCFRATVTCEMSRLGAHHGCLGSIPVCGVTLGVRGVRSHSARRRRSSEDTRTETRRREWTGGWTQGRDRPEVLYVYVAPWGADGRLSCVLDSTTYKVMKHQTNIEQRRQFLLCANGARTPNCAFQHSYRVLWASANTAGSGKRFSIHCSDSPFLAQTSSCVFASFA